MFFPPFSGSKAAVRVFLGSRLPQSFGVRKSHFHFVARWIFRSWRLGRFFRLVFQLINRENLWFLKQGFWTKKTIFSTQDSKSDFGKKPFQNWNMWEFFAFPNSQLNTKTRGHETLWCWQARIPGFPPGLLHFLGKRIPTVQPTLHEWPHGHGLGWKLRAPGGLGGFGGDQLWETFLETWWVCHVGISYTPENLTWKLKRSPQKFEIPFGKPSFSDSMLKFRGCTLRDQLT